MRHRHVAALAAMVGLLATAVVAAPQAQAANGAAWAIDTWGLPRDSDNVVLKWNEQLLDTIRANPAGTGPTVAARSLGVLHTSMYDAWTAYDAFADPTQSPPGWQRRPVEEWTQANKETAISFAAYRTLVDLFPYRRSVYLAALGGDDSFSSTAALVGDLAAQANITFRHGDGSNPTVDTRGTENPYDDIVSYPCAPSGSTCFYSSTRKWNEAIDPWRWQPLCVPVASSGATCGGAVQQPLTPQWSTVIPFGPLNPETHLPYEFDNSPFNPPKLPDGSYDPAEIDQALRDTSSLTDAQKVKAEYWADGPGSEFPPGHMALFAQALSRMRQNTLDQDVKLFFALGNALLDASVSAWGVKYKQDFWRPITAIRYRYADKQVNSWLGPGKGYGRVPGQKWQPYQALNVVTPPFPEYVSGHSTFSAAGRTVLLAFFGTDNFNAKVTIRAGSSKIEQGVPAKDVVLSWNTLTAAADEAGMSRRYGGIHFVSGDQHGRTLGRVIGYNDWNKAQTYFDGTAIPAL
jgi:PAP2 superfamily